MEFASEQTANADALLMGRRTYEDFAAAWPQMDESDPTTGAAYFNHVKKYVASTTLTNPEWNNSEVLQGDVVEAVRKLKASVSYHGGGVHPGLLDGVQDLQPEHLHGSEFHDEYLRTAPDPAGWATLVARVKAFDAGLPRCRLAILPGTTHTTISHRAAWLAPMIDEFLDR